METTDQSLEERVGMGFDRSGGWIWVGFVFQVGHPWLLVQNLRFFKKWRKNYCRLRVVNLGDCGLERDRY